MRRSAEEILEESKAAVQLYFHSEKDRYKLILIRQATKIFSKGIQLLFIAAFSCIALCFLFGALALVWGHYLNSYALGFAYTGLCIIGLIIIGVMLSKILIATPIMRAMMREMFEDDNDEDVEIE